MAGISKWSDTIIRGLLPRLSSWITIGSRTGSNRARRCRTPWPGSLRIIPRRRPNLFKFNEWLVNTEGATVFIPVSDVTRQCISAMLLYFDRPHGYYIVDQRLGNDPLRPFVKSGLLGADHPVDLADFERWQMVDMNGVEEGLVVQNLMIATQALGIGGHPFSGGKGRVTPKAWATGDSTPTTTKAPMPMTKLARASSQSWRVVDSLMVAILAAWVLAVLAKGQYYYNCLKDYDTAVRYFEQARPLLPNDSRIPVSLAYVARRRGQWDRSESYFDQAERLDPRNVGGLTQHALFYKCLRRFPDAVRKLDQVLIITPDDQETLATKAAIALAEGDLSRASALLTPLHLSADLTEALETQVYLAILERQPAPMITRLQEVLAKPDPALGYINGDLRFYLGWAQEVAGDHAGAQESWRHARSELEPFRKSRRKMVTCLRVLR